MIDRKVMLEGGNEDSKTSIAMEVPTLILLKEWVIKASLILHMASTMRHHMRLGEVLMTSLPMRTYQILVWG